MVSGKKTHGSFGDLDRQKIRVEKKNDKKLWPRIITIIFSRKCFFFFDFSVGHLKLFQEQTKNNQLESEVATLRHENYQMKFTKTHRKQDYV